VIRATIRINQKCFVLRDPKTGKLANKFILVANLEATDGGEAIKAGNARVIRARLSDAKFFWDTDRKTKLEARLPKFEQITFHEKLGTQAERIERIARLAKELAPVVKADPAKGRDKRAAREGRPAHRSRRRVPRSAGPDGQVLRACRRHRRRRRCGLRGTLQAARARTTAFPTRRSRSPSRSRTSSTRWSDSGRSTKSRPARKTLTRCAARRSA
jgi:hypothetical protein